MLDDTLSSTSFRIPPMELVLRGNMASSSVEFFPLPGSLKIVALVCDIPQFSDLSSKAMLPGCGPLLFPYFGVRDLFVEMRDPRNGRSFSLIQPHVIGRFVVVIATKDSRQAQAAPSLGPVASL